MVLSSAREQASTGAASGLIDIEGTASRRILQAGVRRQPGGLRGRATRGPAPRFHVLHEIFEAQADARPDAVAVVFGREEATYAALEHRVNRIARHLRARGVRRGSRVAILLSRSVDAYAALLRVRLQHGRRARRSRQGTHRSNHQGEGRNGTTGTKGTR